MRLGKRTLAGTAALRRIRAEVPPIQLIWLSSPKKYGANYSNPRVTRGGRSTGSAEDFASIGIVYCVLPGSVWLAAGNLGRRVLHRLATGDV